MTVIERDAPGLCGMYFGEIAKLVQIGAAMPGEDYDSANAALYDVIERYTGDVPFYLREARRSGCGEVLELGCGTGRVLLPLARAGLHVTGIDLSPAMLDTLRDKLLAEHPAVGDRVTLHEGDMREMALGRRFALIICPLYTFIHLVSRADKERVFARAMEHLLPGGRLLLEAELMSSFRETASPELTVVRYDRRTGTKVLVLQQGRREPGGGVLVNLLNIVIDAGGRTTLHAVASRESRTSPAELSYLAHLAGLEVEGVWGDYDGGELLPGARGVVFAARRPGR